MIVENTTFISGDRARNAVIKSGKKEYRNRFIFSGLTLLFGAFVLIGGISITDWNYIVIGGMFTAFGLFYIIYSLITLAKLPAKKEKENEEIFSSGMTFIYKFKEQSMNITTKTASKTVKNDYSYAEVKKVYDMGDEYHLYTKDGVFFYIFKDSFIEPKNKMIEFFIKNLALNKKKIIDKTKKKAN